jgi:hypothetical protein
LLQDKVDVTFIPAGFDTVDLISIASGLPVASSSTFKSGFEQEFRTHAAQVGVALINMSDLSSLYVVLVVCFFGSIRVVGERIGRCLVGRRFGAGDGAGVAQRAAQLRAAR